MVTIVKNTVLHTWKLLKADLKHSYHTRERVNCEVMDVSIILTLVMVLQYTYIKSSHLPLKYIQLYIYQLFLNKV